MRNDVIVVKVRRAILKKPMKICGEAHSETESFSVVYLHKEFSVGKPWVMLEHKHV